EWSDGRMGRWGEVLADRGNDTRPKPRFPVIVPSRLRPPDPRGKTADRFLQVSGKPLLICVDGGHATAGRALCQQTDPTFSSAVAACRRGATGHNRPFCDLL